MGGGGAGGDGVKRRELVSMCMHEMSPDPIYVQVHVRLKQGGGHEMEMVTRERNVQSIDMPNERT